MRPNHRFEVAQAGNIYKFMKSTRSFGRIAGIPVKVQMNWFPSIILVTWSIAGGYFPSQYPQWEPLSYWSIGLLTAVLFFISVLLHELGHSIIAVREGIRVDGITLFLLGGMAQIAREPSTPGSEVRVVAAGPLTSLALAGFFYVLNNVIHPYPQIAAAALYMTYVNLILAIFNLIPGFPLDGGRLLRALLWKLVNHHARATHWAALIGFFFAGSLFLSGLLAFFAGHYFAGFWLIVIGWYLAYLSKANIHVPRRQALAYNARFVQSGVLLKNYSMRISSKSRNPEFSLLEEQPVVIIEEGKQKVASDNIKI